MAMNYPNFLCGHDIGQFVEINDHRNSFPCDNCQTALVGTRLTCPSCGFNLHHFCRACPPLLSSPAHHPHPLTLTRAPTTPPGAPPERWCNVCLDTIRGSRYSCHVDPRCDFDVHPLCSQLAPRAHQPRAHISNILAPALPAATTTRSIIQPAQQPLYSGFPNYAHPGYHAPYGPPLPAYTGPVNSNSGSSRGIASTTTRFMGSVASNVIANLIAGDLQNVFPGL